MPFKNWQMCFSKCTNSSMCFLKHDFQFGGVLLPLIFILKNALISFFFFADLYSINVTVR